MKIEVGTVLKHKLEAHSFTIVKIEDDYAYTSRETVMPVSFFQNDRYFEIMVDSKQ